MRLHERLAGQLVDRTREPLRKPSRVDEDQCRRVRANELEQSRMNGRPDGRRARTERRGSALDLRLRRQLGHVLDRDFDLSVSFFFSPVSMMVTGRKVAWVRSAFEFVVELVSGCPVVGLQVFSPENPTTRQPDDPLGNCATSSSGLCVADSPILCGCLSQRIARRSSETAMCAPRLFGTSAWISSMMIVSMPRRTSRAFEVAGGTATRAW